MTTKIEPAAALTQLQNLAANIPDFGGAGTPAKPEVLRWLGQLTALVELQSAGDTLKLSVAIGQLTGYGKDDGVHKILSILFSALARAELAAPASMQGRFVAAGASFDAIAAIRTVIGRAGRDVLIIDPYLAGNALFDFAITAPESAGIRLLGMANTIKADLFPAMTRWQQQFGSTRPLEVRKAVQGLLHDRLIVIDEKEVWDLTQSLNALAARSPATVSRANSDTERMKLDAYGQIWRNAAVYP